MTTKRINAELRWNRIATKLLVGRKIISVRYMLPDEYEEFGWTGSTLVIFLDDGSYFYASQDDEGNGPGALHTSDATAPILPVI